jgi:hypothetical protein
VGPTRMTCSEIKSVGLARMTWSEINTVGLSPNIRYIWQGNHRIYGHKQCKHLWFWPTLRDNHIYALYVIVCDRHVYKWF